MTYERSTIRRLTISIVSCCLSVRKLTRTRRGEQKPNSQPRRDAGRPDAIGANVIDRADVRVVQRGRRSGLALKSFQRLAVLCQFVGKKFERDESAQGIPAVDLAGQWLGRCCLQ